MELKFWEGGFMGRSGRHYRVNLKHGEFFIQEYKVQTANISGTASRHRRRTADDFLAFCTMVLDYENYDAMRQEV